MTQEKNSKNFNFLPEAMIAALIPIYGYYIAYRYETGFFMKFNIPTSFIEVSISEVLRVLGGLFTLIFILYFFIEIFIRAGISKNPIIRSFGRIVWPSLIFLLFFILSNPPFIFVIFFLIFILFMLIIEFIFPLINLRGIKGFKKKLELQEDIDRKEKFLVDIIIKGIAKKFGISAFLILLLLILSLFFIDNISTFEAMRKRSFLIIKSNPELVVLRKYSQNFICATFDRETKEIHNTFYLKNFEQIANEGLQIVKEDIGPLQATKTKIITKKKDKRKKINKLRGSQRP